MEGSADHVNIETDMIVSDLSCQENTDFEEILDTTWAKALPFVPGQKYHSGGKFL